MELNLIDLVMIFFLKYKEIELRGIQEKPSKMKILDSPIISIQMDGVDVIIIIIIGYNGT